MSYFCSGMEMTRMWKVPAPQLRSREGSGYLSSLKWPQGAPPPLLEGPLSSPLLRPSLAQLLNQQPSPTLRLQQPLRDSSPRGDGGLQKTTRSLKFNLHPPSTLTPQLFLQLTTLYNEPICQETAAKHPRAHQPVKWKFLPDHQIKSLPLFQTKKLWNYQKKPKLFCQQRGSLHCRPRSSPWVDSCPTRQTYRGWKKPVSSESCSNRRCTKRRWAHILTSASIKDPLHTK